MFSTNDKIDVFQRLAKSQPEFNSVGRLFYFVESSRGQYTVTHSNIQGYGDAEIQYQSSGVYIGNNIVITAAHCIPDNIKSGEFIKNLNQHYYFKTENNEDKITCRVLMAIRHPEYVRTEEDVCVAKNDIAVLLLDRDPCNISKAEIDFSSFSIKYDCIAIGYSKYVRPVSQDRRELIEGKSNETFQPRVAVKIPECHNCGDVAINVIGQAATELKSYENHNKIAITSTKRNYQVEEAGINQGMSGGGWFSNNYKVFAISFHIWFLQQDRPKDRNCYTNVSGDAQGAVLLSSYQQWIDKTSSSLQSKLPSLKKDIIEWHTVREKYELERFPEITKKNRAEIAKKFAAKVKKNSKYLPFFMKDENLTALSESKVILLKNLTPDENKESKELETIGQETFLTGIRVIDNLILEYVTSTHEDKDNTQNYSLLSMGNTLFEKNVAVIALLGHVARGEQSQADAMLQKNPFLLLGYGRTTDYTCTADGLHYRTLEGTAYRIALGAKDVKFHPDEECMVEMIIRHFKRLPNWEAEMKKQYDDQFPAADPAKGIKGWKAEAKERAVLDSLEINKVFKAVHDAKPENDTYEACEKACEPALKEFRDYLDNQIKGKVFKTGFHFNDWPVDEKEQEDITYGLFGEALKLYIHYFPIFGDSYGNPKNDIGWRKIVGYIQRFFPACLAQAFCTDLYYYVGQGEKLERRLSLKYVTRYSWFPLLVSSGLGCEWPLTPHNSRRGESLWRFSELISSKNSLITDYDPARAINASPVCDNVNGP